MGYDAAVSGSLELVPTGDSRAALANAYTRMFEDGTLPDDAESVDAVMTTCETIANRANQQI